MRQFNGKNVIASLAQQGNLQNDNTLHSPAGKVALSPYPESRFRSREAPITARPDRSRRSAMGFFNALKRLLPHASHELASEESRQRIRAAWGLDDDESDTAGRGDDHALPATKTGSNASVFDRAQWQKRLRRILDGLPGSQPQWHVLMTDAHALQLEPDWIADRQREEFAFIIRRAVADKVISEEDHGMVQLRVTAIPEVAIHWSSGFSRFRYRLEAGFLRRETVECLKRQDGRKFTSIIHPGTAVIERCLICHDSQTTILMNP